jgi:hypothetical protein
MKPLFLSFILALLASLAAFAGDAPDTTKPADIENMKAIGAALTAFKKAKGEYPDHLSDLVPDFLDAKTLVSPLGVEADPRAAAKEYDPKLPCTYCYEFGTNDFLGRGISFRALKIIQLQEYGPTLPLLRCFLYEKALNLSHAGDFFETEFNWEWDAETARLMKKNGLGPGAQAGKKLIVTLTDEAGHPVPGITIWTSDRSCFNLPLPERPFVADASGKITIPLGLDRKPQVLIVGSDPHWFLRAHVWTFGVGGPPPNDDVASLIVVVTPGAAIGGTVLDAQGHPLADAGISLSLLPDPKHPEDLDQFAIDSTDEHGAWTIKNVPAQASTLYLRINHPGSRTLEGRLGTPGLPDAAFLFARTAEIRLAAPFPVKGTVRFADQPVAGARVFLSSAANPTITDANGQFEILADTQGIGHLTIVANDLAPKCQAVKVAAGAPPLVVTLDAGRPLKGRLLRGQRAGIANTPILFNGFANRLNGAPLPSQPVIATTDAEGRFTWPHAPKDVVACQALLPEGGDPWDFEWDATKNDEFAIHVDR